LAGSSIDRAFQFREDAMTYMFPCTDCGVVIPTKLRKPKRCAPCAKAEALDYSRWNYRAHRDELLEYHRNHYRKNRKRILAKRAARRAAKVQSPSTTATARRRFTAATATSPGRPGRRSTGRSTSTGDELLALSGRYPKNFNARPSSGFFPSYARAAAPVAGTCGRGSKWHCVLRADCFGCG
jgi:hypothetical protein